MLLQEEVAYGVVPVEGRAAADVLHQETLHSLHEDGQKGSRRARTWVGNVRSHEQERTRERARVQARGDIPASSRN